MADETITESEIWTDIDAAFPRLEERQPGDIDVRQWAAHFHITESTARLQMKKLAAKGEWKMVNIRDETGGDNKRMVIRRVSACPN